ANIDRAEDAARATEYGSEGIGLFRSEYLYLGRTSAPSEEEQFAEYRKAAEAVAPKELVIRTADLGADKLPEHMEDTGLRGLAFSLKEEQLFKTQLRALYRAAEYGNIKLMFPMVNTVTELSKAVKLCEEVRLELGCRAAVPVGVMIETLEAVENCAELAKAADFFSIGTNDLYHELTGAGGRDKEIVEDQSVRETVADMIEKTVKTAHEKGREVTVCGRMAENARMAERFAGIGVDAVSLPLALIKEKA
nr:phosphoenolpyruvate--protein phosphotransferase [Lachnospiraceae bacterium]